MGGFFGVVSRNECVNDVFYGTDYHSHLGTRRAGMALLGRNGFTRRIHDISNAQFRSKFETDLPEFEGRSGLGVISDFEDQPLLITSHLGTYAIVTICSIRNLDELAQSLFAVRRGQFSETSDHGINPTEMVAALINTQASFEEGLQYVQESVEGACSVLILTDKGALYAARDRYGRIPMVLGSKDGSRAVAVESCCFPNLDYHVDRELGPGEVACLTPEGDEIRALPRNERRVCAFFWVYFGFPASSYEGINVEDARYRCGELLARRSPVEADLVAGVPDSGVGHALGYALGAGIPYKRPFVKYTPTWPRSFTPPDPAKRRLIANKKLIPIPELIHGQRMIFCDDSIVRGNQMKQQSKRLFDGGAREIHLRVACPPLLFSCPFLNFTRTGVEDDLFARKMARQIDGDNADFKKFCIPDSDRYKAMIERIRTRLGLTSLHYQSLEDMIAAIGLPRHQLCTYCWTGEDITRESNCTGCKAAKPSVPS